MSAESTITYLEMLSREELQPAASVEGFELLPIEPGDAALNRRFYDRIWDWTGRKEWTGLDWQVHVERETLHTLVGRMGGEEIGFAELEVQPEAQVKFHYFGLLPEFVGRGLGGAMLTASIRYAWDLPGTRRVWLHTCSEDHEAALPNYERRGFHIYDIKKEPVTD